MVQILMSTYNGEKFLKEQIDSLLNQTYSDIEILIRDDGSKDGTLDIIRQYSDEYGNVSYYIGDNVGAMYSFFDLLQHVNEDADFIATCDQDDIWQPDKIEIAVKCLEAMKEPALYCSKLQLVDEELNYLVDKLHNYTPKIGFGNAVIENICTGCTMVMNRTLYDLSKGKIPEKCIMHDLWFYQLATCFGQVVYDETSHILYRQHSQNVVGLDNGRWALVKRQIKSFKKFRDAYTNQMNEFLRLYDLPNDKLKVAKRLVDTKKSWKARFAVLFGKDIYRQGFYDNILFKWMLFFGLL